MTNHADGRQPSIGTAATIAAYLTARPIGTYVTHMASRVARGRVSRLVHALMMVVWCGVVAARAVAMPCPTGGHGLHGQLPATPIPSALPASAHHGQGAHAGHQLWDSSSAVSEHAHSSPHGPTQDAPAHSCDCLGHCCATAVVLPPVFPIGTIASPAIARPTFVVSRSVFVAEWIDFVLPFAIAPPVSAHT